jgi:uncharacterized membrane protein
MNPEYESKLEAAIDRELKGLPELTAPNSLSRRVMAAIERRATVPWYRTAWQNWPLSLRIPAMALLVVFFGALCFGVWKLPHTEVATVGAAKVSGWFSVFATLWNALNAVVGVFVLAFKQLGTGLIAAIVGAIVLAWVMCLGVGTACVRLAWARR